MRTRAEPHRSFFFTNNVVIWNQGTVLGSDWSGTPENFVIDGNLYWDLRAGANASAYHFQKRDWAAWQAAGHDVHSRIGDPLLRDNRRPELGLLPASPAFALGFQPIDLRTVGPR
jgi:hypothetical protein